MSQGSNSRFENLPLHYTPIYKSWVRICTLHNEPEISYQKFDTPAGGVSSLTCFKRLLLTGTSLSPVFTTEVSIPPPEPLFYIFIIHDVLRKIKFRLFRTYARPQRLSRSLRPTSRGDQVYPTRNGRSVPCRSQRKDLWCGHDRKG